MSWLTTLLAGLFPSPTGLKIDEADPLAVHVQVSPGRFFQALPLLWGTDAWDAETMLYLEGGIPRSLAAWLARETTEPRPRFHAGVSPVSDYYHLPLTPDFLAALAIRFEQSDGRRRRLRLHVSIHERLLLEWRHAFTSKPLLLSRSIPADHAQAFLRAVAGPPA